MHLMTYISPRVAIWGPFCVPPVYTVYNNSRSRKELCTRMRTGGISMALLFPSRFLASFPPPLPLPPLPHPGRRYLFVSFYHSRFPPHSSARLRVSFTRAGLPSWTFLASCATVNHSACDCVQLITVIRLFLVPVYRTLIIIIDFSRTSLPYFHAVSYAQPRGCTAKRISIAPCHTTDHGKACHSV